MRPIARVGSVVYGLLRTPGGWRPASGMVIQGDPLVKVEGPDIAHLGSLCQVVNAYPRVMSASAVSYVNGRGVARLQDSVYGPNFIGSIVNAGQAVAFTE